MDRESDEYLGLQLLEPKDGYSRFKFVKKTFRYKDSDIRELSTSYEYGCIPEKLAEVEAIDEEEKHYIVKLQYLETTWFPTHVYPMKPIYLERVIKDGYQGTPFENTERFGIIRWERIEEDEKP